METMKTEKPKTTSAKAPHPLAAELASMDGVPVHELTFCVGMNNKPDIPVLDATGGMGKLRARPGRSITFLPKLLLYRVMDASRDPQIKDRTFYIPREWATFEPLE